MNRAEKTVYEDVSKATEALKWMVDKLDSYLNKCQPCNSSCIACTSTDVCTSCFPEFIMSKNQCIACG